MSGFLRAALAVTVAALADFRAAVTVAALAEFCALRQPILRSGYCSSSVSGYCSCVVADSALAVL